MINYLLGILFVLISIILYQFIGLCLTKNESNSYAFIIGFIVYSFCVAILGMGVQFLNLSWKAFYYGMILIWCSLIGIIVYNIIYKNIKVSKDIVLDYIKKNWFIYIGSFFLLLFALSHVATIWSNNLTDDSYYVNLMSTLPYIENPFHTDPVTGFITSSFSLERIINTFELEGSFYIYITKIPGTLYARMFLAYLNYYIMLNAINAFIIKVTKKEMKYNQYIIVSIFLLFVMNAYFFLSGESAWTITSAAYFGSALVRITCPFIIMIPLINDEKLDIKKVIITFMTCLVMVSKSTCAIPIIFLLAIGYLVSYKINNKYWLFGLIPIIGVAGAVLTNNSVVENFSLKMFLNNTTSILLIASIVIIFAQGIKKFEYRRLLFIFLVSIILSFLPCINNLYELLTQYTFVSDRTWYTMAFFIIIPAVYAVFDFLINKFVSRKHLCLQIIVIFMLFISSSLGSIYLGKNEHSGMAIRNFISIYKNNKYIIPQGTMDLGIELNDYYENYHKELKVLMSPGLNIDGYAHNTAAILRIFAPHIQSITGGLRTQTEIINNESEFNGFDLDDLYVFSDFEINPSNETLTKLNELNKKYPFDCLIVLNPNETHQILLNSIGYSGYKKVYDKQQRYCYEIYIK